MSLHHLVRQRVWRIPHVVFCLLLHLLLLHFLVCPSVAADERVSRILPLYPAFSDILEALGAQATIVGRTNAEKNPALAHLPSVGTHMRPNVERILACSPDLVLQLQGRADARLLTEQLQRLGLSVAELPLNSFADLWRVTEFLGHCVGREERAADLVRAWQARIAALRDEWPTKTPRIVVEVRYPNLLLAGAQSFVDDILRAIGARNAITTEKKFVRLSEEALFALDPDCYVVLQGPMHPNPVPLDKRPGWDRLSAVRAHRVLLVPEERAARPGSGTCTLCEELAAWRAQVWDQHN